MSPYKIVDEFEKCVAEYAGAKYGVAVNSCSNALLISAVYRKMTEIQKTNIVKLPKYTYVGVAYALINAGYKIQFTDEEWVGNYEIEPLNIIDSARRFTKFMYVPDTLYCLSFHWYKHLPIGRGGMILTDNKEEADILRKIRFDGRTAGVAPKDDNFIYPGYHCYLIPEDAARGLMLMGNIKDNNKDLIENNYSDLSQHKIFTGVY